MTAFRTTILQARQTATGLPVPESAVTALGAGKKPAVIVTVNGYRYRSSIASMGGQFLIPLSAEHRAASGLAAGDEVEVELVVDEEPRSVALPPELADALAADATLATAYAALSYSKQRALVEPIDQAKTEDTRIRRIEKALAALGHGSIV